MYYKWQFEFSKVMDKFFVEKNIVLLDDIINELFVRFTPKIIYLYISKY